MFLVKERFLKKEFNLKVLKWNCDIILSKGAICLPSMARCQTVLSGSTLSITNCNHDVKSPLVLDCVPKNSVRLCQ